MSDSFELVLAELESQTGYAPRGTGDRRKAMCPAHEDQKASLVVRNDRDAGLIGITCFAGCTFEEVRGALGLESIDFRISTNGHHARRPKAPRESTRQEPVDTTSKEVARYTYTDADGVVLYHNVRFEPKDFRMANKMGEIKQLPKNQRRVPYNLVEVQRAVAAGRTVYWVEGEKDVHTLATLGEVGTTSAGGAMAPVLSDWASYFRGAHVVVVCDKDKSGRSYGRNVARALINEAADVRLAEPATPQPKSDISDHLATGYRLDQLEWISMRAIRRTRWSMSAILEHKPEPMRWVWPGVIPEGLTLLVGAPKAGKSWVDLQLTFALASGRPDLLFAWGQQIEPSPALYCALEDPQRRVYSRGNQILRSLPDLKLAHDADVWLDIPPIAEGGREQIEEWLEAHPNARAVLVDVLAKVRSHPKSDAPLYQVDYDAIGALKDIADDHGISVIVTHHDRKKADDDFLNMVSGTKGITGAADTILYLTRKRGSTEGEMKLESRDVEECKFQMEFHKAAGRWHVLNRIEGNDDTPKDTTAGYERLRRMIAARGDSSAEDLARIVDTDVRAVRKTLKLGEEEGVLGQTSNGLWYVVEGA